MLGFDFGISTRAISDVQIHVLSVESGACLDIRHDLEFDLRARARLEFDLDIEHTLEFDLRAKAEGCDGC